MTEIIACDFTDLWVHSTPQKLFASHHTAPHHVRCSPKSATQPTSCITACCPTDMKRNIIRELQAQTARLRGLSRWSDQYLVGFPANYFEGCLGQPFAPWGVQCFWHPNKTCEEKQKQDRSIGLLQSTTSIMSRLCMWPQGGLGGVGHFAIGKGS